MDEKYIPSKGAELDVEQEILLMRFIEGENLEPEELALAESLLINSVAARIFVEDMQECSSLCREALGECMDRIHESLNPKILSTGTSESQSLESVSLRSGQTTSLWDRIESRIIEEEKMNFFSEQRQVSNPHQISQPAFGAKVDAIDSIHGVPAARYGFGTRLAGFARGIWSSLIEEWAGRVAWGASGALVAASVTLLLVTSPVNNDGSSPNVPTGIDFVPVASLSSEGQTGPLSQPVVPASSRYEVEWLRSGGRVELIEGQDRSAPVIWVRKPSGSARVSLRSSAEGSVVKVVPENDVTDENELE